MYGAYYNPYAQGGMMPMQSVQMPMQGGGNNNGIIRVNGENGARAYQMPPNSAALLLDETAPVVWLVQTDGAGYKTAQAYDIEPRKGAGGMQGDGARDADISALESRIARLEGIIGDGGKSDTETGRQGRKG